MFVNDPVVDALIDRPDLWAVKEQADWIAPDLVVHIPVGFITDFASIPQALRNIFDVDGLSRGPALLHDALYAAQQTSRAFADEQLRKGLIAYGESAFTARVYWLGVRMGGGSSWASDAPRNGLVGVEHFDTPQHWAAYVSAGKPFVSYVKP